MHDATLVKFLLRQTLLQREKEEEERNKEEEEENKMLVVNRRVRDGTTTPAEEAALRRWMGIAPGSSSSSSGKRRTRKKRRKRRTPRTSSNSSCGRARRRLRKWHARLAGLPGDVPFRAVFPLVVVRPAMFDFMAVVNQKDSTSLVVNNLGSGMCRVVFTGYDALCVMFLSGVAMPKMLCILAGMDQIVVQSAETVESPQLQFIKFVDNSLLWCRG